MELEYQNKHSNSINVIPDKSYFIAYMLLETVKWHYKTNFIMANKYIIEFSSVAQSPYHVCTDCVSSCRLTPEF